MDFWQYSFDIQKSDRTKPVVEQIVGSMALSGMELSQEDYERILYLLHHPDEEDAMPQTLIAKHTV